MLDTSLILIAVVFAIAGFVKGVIGLGLPTVSMGLLAVAMPPVQALAIVIAPALFTNIWQTFVGGYLRDIIRRLWPLMLGAAIGIWSGRGLMTGPYAHYGTILLGLLLIVYGLVSLRRLHFTVSRQNEKPIGGVVGLITGVIAAATGVQVIPSMPFMQSIGMEKEELIQALGVYFTVCTLAQALNLSSEGILTASTALPGLIAMITAFAGMFIGQAVRNRMHPDQFRRWFLIAMMLLGVYLAGIESWELLS